MERGDGGRVERRNRREWCQVTECVKRQRVVKRQHVKSRSRQVPTQAGTHWAKGGREGGSKARPTEHATCMAAQEERGGVTRRTAAPCWCVHSFVRARMSACVATHRSRSHGRIFGFNAPPLRHLRHRAWPQIRPTPGSPPNSPPSSLPSTTSCPPSSPPSTCLRIY